MTPESTHQVTILFSDRGTPSTYRKMNGYSSHTYKWYNDKGEYFWVQYHFKTDQKIKNLTRQEAEQLKGSGPDHATHIHRLGPNYHLIPVNALRHVPEKSYQRDGFMRVDGNGAAGPNYWPNSFGGPKPDPSAAEPDFEVDGFAGRHAFNQPNDDFVQAGNLYRNVMKEQDKQNLIGNIVTH